jgi:hypothetical protein
MLAHHSRQIEFGCDLRQALWHHLHVFSARVWSSSGMVIASKLLLSLDDIVRSIAYHHTRLRAVHCAFLDGVFVSSSRRGEPPMSYTW